MEENKKVQVPEEKSPVVRPKAEAVVKEPAGLPLEVKLLLRRQLLMRGILRNALRSHRRKHRLKRQQIQNTR